MNSALLFMFLLWFIPCLYTAVLSFFCKRSGRSVRPYATMLVLLNVVFIVYSINPVPAASLFSSFTGNYNIEAAGFYSAYLLLIFNGSLIGTALGFLFWKWKYDKTVPVQSNSKGKNKGKNKGKRK